MGYMFFDPEVSYTSEQAEKLLGTLRKEIRMAEHQLGKATRSCRASGVIDKKLEKSLVQMKNELSFLTEKFSKI